MTPNLFYVMAFVVFWLSLAYFGLGVVRGIRRRVYWVSVVCGSLMLFQLWFGLLIGFTPGAAAYEAYCNREWMYRETGELFGKRFDLGYPRIAYNSERGLFNGDGSSIEVYDIPDSLIAFINDPAHDFLASFPKKPEYLTDWKQVHWKQTATLSAQDLEAMSYSILVSGSKKEVQVAQDLLQASITEPGNYIAYCYNMNGSEIWDVDFYLISPSHKVFIWANRNM